MVRKVSESIKMFFKKSDNDWLKVTLSTFFTIIMIIMLSKSLVASYASLDTLPDTLTTGQGDVIQDRVNLFDELTDDEVIALIPFYALDENSNKYTVYCLEKEKGWSPNQTITKSDVPLDSGYTYLMQHGYPNNSLTGNDKNDDYLTQIALWWYQDKVNNISDEEDGVLTANQKRVIKASGYYKYIESLINGAVDAKNNPVVVNPTFSLDSSNFKLSSDNTYLITDLINVNSNVSFDTYNVSVNNSAVEILDENNNPVTTSLSSDKGFKLKVNLADIDNPVNVSVSVVVNYTEYVAYSYNPPSDKVDTMQQAVVSTLQALPKQKTVTTNVSMPTGSLSIKKVDSQTGSTLSNANIEVRRVVTNKVVANFTTNEDTYTIDNLLPGEYEIKELSAPAGYYIDNPSKNIVITNDNLNVNETLTNSKLKVSIRKVDSDTGSVVSGAVLKILDSNNSEVYRFTSTNDYVEIPNLVEGSYKVVEVSAPSGYILNDEEREFTLDKDHPNITIDFKNKKNEVIIEKRDASSNDFVDGAKLQLIRVADNKVIDEWVTTSKGYSIYGLIAGDYKVKEIEAPKGYTLSTSEVTFTISNNQTEVKTVTFYNSKNQISIVKVDSETGDIISNAKLQVSDSSGKVIDTFTTSKEPYTLSKLDPGTYYVKELSAPDGYTLTDEVVSFEVTSTTSNLQVQFKNKQNEVRLAKVDKDSGSYVAGAKLRLTDSNGEEVLTFTSGSEPYVKRGLPSGTYYLEEIEAPDGYVLNNSKVAVVVKDTDDVLTYTISNQKTKVTISKVDSETNELIKGVILEIFDSTDTSKDPIKTITTELTPTVLTDLNEGDYYIRETNTPDGYVVDDSLHKFTIDSNNPTVNVVIKNKPITINLGKIDANSGEYISGATLKLSREDGIMEPITFVSSNRPYTIKRLSKGIYSLEEIEAPKGYVSTNSKITFEVTDTGKVQNINISNNIISISINNKKLVVDTKEEAGYKFNIETRDGKVIETFTTTKEVYISDELEIGDYVLKEVDAPLGVIVNSNPIYFSITDNSNVDIINFVNDFTKVNISKKDMANSEEIKGAHLVISNEKGEVVDEWISTDTPHYIEKLPVGNYTLKETIAPDGYILNTSTIDFKVLETLDIQSTVMFNSKPIEVPNTSSDATYIYLIGGSLIIIGGVLIYISYRNKVRGKSS